MYCSLALLLLSIPLIIIAYVDCFVHIGPFSNNILSALDSKRRDLKEEKRTKNLKYAMLHYKPKVNRKEVRIQHRREVMKTLHDQLTENVFTATNDSDAMVWELPSRSQTSSDDDSSKRKAPPTKKRDSSFKNKANNNNNNNKGGKKK